MKKGKILIVDDEMDVRLVFSKRLTNDGYRVITAENGNDGLSLAKSHQPDLIILDIGLPDMHGGEVALQLKQQAETANIPVIFLTCMYTKTQEVEKNHMVGANLMFAKPYDPEEVLVAIRKILQKEKSLA
jgi:two-component system sensor histidine kinase/response regulator